MSRLVTNNAISSCVGFGSFAGGISPLLTFSTTSPQRCESLPNRKSRDSWSSRTSPSCFCGPWQRTQCLVKNPSNDSAPLAAVSSPLQIIPKLATTARHHPFRRRSGTLRMAITRWKNHSQPRGRNRPPIRPIAAGLTSPVYRGVFRTARRGDASRCNSRPVTRQQRLLSARGRPFGNSGAHDAA